MRWYWPIAALMMLGGCALANSSQGPASETAEAGWGGAPLGTDAPGVIEEGKRIAETQCAACHAIDQASRSPDQAAPPLRDVLALYEPDNLAYRLIEGMRVGHDNMPRFDFDVRAADALLAYIGSISRE